MDKKTRKAPKVVVLDDMEGISGISDWHQILGGCKEFEEFGRFQVTEDVNAAIRGLRAAGATEIRIVDYHGSGGPNANVIPEKLEKGAKLFQGARSAKQAERGDRQIHRWCGSRWVPCDGGHQRWVPPSYDNSRSQD